MHARREQGDTSGVEVSLRAVQDIANFGEVRIVATRVDGGCGLRESRGRAARG